MIRRNRDMINRYIYLLFVFFSFLVSCSVDKEKVYEDEKLKVNDHLDVFKELLEFEVQNDSIIGMEINLDGNIFIWKKGIHIKIPMEKAGLSLTTIDLLANYREKLKLLSFTGLKRYKNYIKLTRENKIFSSSCYHIRMYQVGNVSYSGNSIFKLNDGIFLHFEKCISI